MAERERRVEHLENPKKIVQQVMEFQAEIRDTARRQLQEQSIAELETVAAQGAGDVSYRIDIAADMVIDRFAHSFSQAHPSIITSEASGRTDFTGGRRPEFEVLIDPIDGTRGIMYDMRSAWVLTGIAPYREEGTTLADIDIAVQTEIPTTRQDTASVLWAVRGQGAVEEVWDLREGKLVQQRELQPSQASDLRHGFSSLVDYFPGSKREVAELSERFFERVVGPVEEGKAVVFDDTYISSAGQLYLLASGKYRFVADIRPELENMLRKQGRPIGLAAHPYDLSTALIAQEAGVVITDGKGEQLAYPFDTNTNCSWIGYANATIREKVEPVLQEELQRLFAA